MFGLWTYMETFLSKKQYRQFNWRFIAEKCPTVVLNEENVTIFKTKMVDSYSLGVGSENIST